MAKPVALESQSCPTTSVSDTTSSAVPSPRSRYGLLTDDHELTRFTSHFLSDDSDDDSDFAKKESSYASSISSDGSFTRSSTPVDDAITERQVSISPSITPTWTNMPNKGQLAILAASRFVDFFQMAALQTYMVHQLKSFDPTLPDSTISHQAGILQGAFTAAQIFTSILWGRVADRPSFGRKLVLNIGLIGTGVGCIGVGFSKSYEEAVFWRFFSGAINGTVGAARTMVAERTPKPWHSRAFLLLPAAFNVANVLGPILSGMLVQPYDSLSYFFGQNSMFGGLEGVSWMKTYPYALPSLLSTALLFAEALWVHFYLDETLKGGQDSRWRRGGLSRTFKSLLNPSFCRATQDRDVVHDAQRSGLLNHSDRGHTHSMQVYKPERHGPANQSHQRLAFRRMWTPNVLWTLLSIAIFDFHMGAFANLWLLFLATPRAFVGDETKSLSKKPASALKFASGLAFPPPTIGYAMSIIGFIGVTLQFLLYPWANTRFGLMRCFRASLFLFPLAYALAPFIALVPSITASPHPASGLAVWISIASVVFLQVAARTFALPASIILLNNSSPHPSVLATIHGVGQACSATFRTLGPILAGYWHGVWTERGVIGMAWWITATVAAIGCFASFWVRNGSGHEIVLPGDEMESEGPSDPRSRVKS